MRRYLDVFGVRYELVPTLVRGLDYYTRTTWEFVGPEGGFAPEEIAAMVAAGVRPVRLACPILRTETAAPVAVALALDRLGML